MSAARSNDSEIAWVTESSTSSAAKTSIINGCEMVTWFELEDSDDEDSDDEEHDATNNSVTNKASQTFTKSPLHRIANEN